MEEKTKTKDTIELNTTDVEALNNGLKEFSGSIKNHITELKQIDQDLALIHDIKQGIIIETHSRSYNSAQLFDLALQVHQRILDRRGDKKPPLGVG